jgi:SAM-dependent methyltransferase
MSEPPCLLHESAKERARNLALNAINREFYTTFAKEFSRSRSAPWSGWRRVLGHLESSLAGFSAKRLATGLPLVGDIGCGNGRFGRFAAQRLTRPFRYVGLDASADLLELARSAGRAVAEIELIEHDLVVAPLEEPLPRGSFLDAALVAVFGLMHHIPGRRRRSAVLSALGQRLPSGGLLAISFWRFGGERFRGRRVAWPEAEDRLDLPLDALEPGDMLLSWGSSRAAVRYCHLVDPSETSQLLEATGLDCIDRFTSDGHSGDLNEYFVLKR